MARAFPRGELAVVALAAALVSSRVFGLSLVLPTFRPHYGGVFDVDALWIGVAFGAHGLAMAAMQFPLGALSDRIGRRPVILGGTLLFVLGSAWAALAPDVGQLIAARLVQGLGAVSSTAMALVGESVPEARRTRAMAMVGIPTGLAFFLGMIFGPVLAPLISVPGLFWLTAAVGLLAGVPALVVRFPSAAPTPVSKGLGMPVVGLALGGFTMNFALAAVLFFLGPENAQWQRLLPALLVALVGMGLATRLIDRGGLTWQPLAVALGGIAVAAPLAAGAGGALAFFAAGAVFFTLHATLSAALPSQVSRVAGRSGGRGHGVQNVLAYLGTFAGGTVGGAFAAAPLVPFTVLVGLVVACVGLLAVFLRAPTPAPSAAPA